MRKIIFLIFLISSCNISPAIVKEKNIQSCLDMMFHNQKDRYKYLENSKLILIKDEMTSGLNNLHFGKTKIALKEVSPADIHIYYSPNQDTSKRYIKIKYSILTDSKIIVEIVLPNVNETVKFNLTKAGSAWNIKIVGISIT